MRKILKCPEAGSSCQPLGREEADVKGLDIGSSTRKAFGSIEAL